jgi:hypothetical protein
VSRIYDIDSGTGLAGPAVALALGAALYGAAFGLWRSPFQSLCSAVKMPLLLVAVVLTTTVVNTMLAKALGAPLSWRHTLAGMLTGLATAALLLGALSPVAAFFALQCPAPGATGDATAYRALLVAHTAAVGACGFAGCARLLRYLRREVPDPRRAGRVLVAWLLTTGLAGCEWSWVLSPFLAKPGLPVPLINPDAFSGNFFEYLWRVASHGA